jgi:ketosteroid isomerase-like protein
MDLTYTFIVKSDKDFVDKVVYPDMTYLFLFSGPVMKCETVFEYQGKEVKVFPEGSARVDVRAFIVNYFEALIRREKVESI